VCNCFHRVDSHPFRQLSNYLPAKEIACGLAGPKLAIERPSPAQRRIENLMLGRIWPAVLLLLMPIATVAVSTPAGQLRSATIDQRELQAERTLARASQFVSVAHISSRPSCEDVQPPEPLMTPDPLSTSLNNGRRVKVSFIIGTDGHVHSPLILESAGLAGDRHVLQTVRSWRYRPAMCNGVPTETEGKIEFSSR
jgi:TonB family protein